MKYNAPCFWSPARKKGLVSALEKSNGVQGFSKWEQHLFCAMGLLEREVQSWTHPACVLFAPKRISIGLALICLFQTRSEKHFLHSLL